MWKVLADRNDGDTVCLNDGEAWQYMGTGPVFGTVPAFTKVAHCFRHRCHPSAGARLYMMVSPSQEWLEQHTAEVAALLAAAAAEPDIPF